jgi:hypothetical protein
VHSATAPQLVARIRALPSCTSTDEDGEVTHTEITVLNYTVNADVYARYGADFNTEAVNDEILRILNEAAPAGVTIERNGRVLAEDSAVKTAREFDWAGLLKRIDLDTILGEHGR